MSVNPVRRPDDGPDGGGPVIGMMTRHDGRRRDMRWRAAGLTESGPGDH